MAMLLMAAHSGSVRGQHGDPIDDKDIRVVSYEDLIYPTIAVMGNVEGVVIIRVTLDDQGRVLDATALSGTPLLVRASIDNSKKLRLQPNSEKTAVIAYNFRIEGYCHNNPAASQTILYPPNLLAVTACRRPAVP